MRIDDANDDDDDDDDANDAWNLMCLTRALALTD